MTTLVGKLLEDVWAFVGIRTQLSRTDGMSSTCPFRGTTAYENELGCRRRRRMWSFALVEPKEPADEFDPGCH
jgi:hypothetical protein